MKVYDENEPENYNGKMMEVAKENERVIFNYLNKQKCFVEVNDVSDEPNYQRLDIDFVVYTKSGIKSTFEVKSDKHLSQEGNVLLEIERWYDNDFIRGYGWLWFSKADFLVVRNPNTGYTLIFDFIILRKVVRDFYRTRGQSALELEKIIKSDSLKSTRFLLLPTLYVINKCKDVYGKKIIKKTL